ncbi:AMP-binding protein, partial [Acinetobacter baumannii]
AAALHSIGVVSGERVGILLPQSLDAALAHLAVYRLGAIAVPLSSVLGGDAVSYRLVHSGARFLLASAEAAEANDKDIPGEIQ